MARTEREIRHLFRVAYNGEKNFMTPDHVAYGQRGGLVYEISRGRGITGAPLFGVTVLTDTGERCHNLSRAFGSEQAARAYARTLGT